jgi:glycosyltransferase involved in cell wall biosynthesis
MTSQISVVINTLNEEAHIADCIRSVQELADEVVVCDMYSEDRTAEIAARLGARVVMYERVSGSWTGEPRRYAIQQASYDWILMIDADERLTPELADRLRQVALSDQYDCVKFAKLEFYFGGFLRHGGTFRPGYPLFFRKQVYLDNYTGVENLAHKDWEAVRNVERTLILPRRYHYIHISYPTVEKYIHKTLGMYSRLEADQMFQAGQGFRLWRLVCEPIKSFCRDFLFFQGFRNGIRGFIVAVLRAIYRFNVWANLWFLEQGGEPASMEALKEYKDRHGISS